jgi:hypothetical protein
LKLDPITWILITAALLGGGIGGYFVGGGGSKDDSAEVAQAIGVLSEAVTRPLTLDAETRAGLSSDMPTGCLDPKMSITPACLAAACWRFQQSDAGRSDSKSCSELVDDARIQSWISICGMDDADSLPNWKCVDLAIKAAREQD